ncbi:MAG: hypothetical protein KG029_01155, partial [Bacteroidetes bacterium]|nr:hypothetical protein [Bacteroidota bacterium]
FIFISEGLGLRQPAFGGVKDFRDLQVWNKAVDLFEQAVKDINSFPNTEAAKIISNQALRSISFPELYF